MIVVQKKERKEKGLIVYCVGMKGKGNEWGVGLHVNRKCFAFYGTRQLNVSSIYNVSIYVVAPARVGGSMVITHKWRRSYVQNRKPIFLLLLFRRGRIFVMGM